MGGISKLIAMNLVFCTTVSLVLVCYTGTPTVEGALFQLGRRNIQTELVAVHAICRHGKRTTYSFYPTDPYMNSTFYPMGQGGMLNEGKYTGFRLGERLREEYGSFLGSMYTDDLILARSTDTPRTRMTAQVILAGMFPPNDNQSWHPTLKWMPIPVYTKPWDDEDLINPNCDYRKKLLEDLPNDPEINKKFIEPYKDLFKFVEEKSGKKINSLSELVEFYFIIHSEQGMGLPLPEWTKEVYPQAIYDAVSHVYAYQNSNLEAKRIHIGYLLKSIINDTIAKFKGEYKPQSRKLFLYGAHESTIGWMMEHLNVLKPQVPPYSSSFIIEGHKDKEQNLYIKLRYLNNLDEPIKDLKMPDCDVLCPIDTFQRINQEVLPTVSLKEACSSCSTQKVSLSFFTFIVFLSLLSRFI